MSIKVLIKFQGNGDGALEKSSKLAIPKAWSTKSVVDVIGLFTKAYNAKSEVQLVAEDMHLVAESGEKVYSDAQVSHALGDHCDYDLRPGKYIRHEAKEEVRINAAGKPFVKCKNYGCQKLFDEDDNTEDSCKCHSGPPIFHDTMKCWSCCRDRKAYDFENFQLITGCATRRHSTEDPTVALHSRHAVLEGAEQAGAAAATAAAAAPVLRSIADYNQKEGGTTAAEEAVKILRQERKSSRHATDGTAKCQRKGCGKTFNVEGNVDRAACVHHSGQPVFHDAVKFWGCCPEKKCYDFESFLAVPGCSRGVHDDGVVSLTD